MEQTKLAMYQLSSLSPDAELLISTAIANVFGPESVIDERPIVLKDLQDKIHFSKTVGGEISSEFLASTKPVIIAGGENVEVARDMLKQLARELDRVRKGNRSGYADIIGIPVEDGDRKLSGSIEQVAQGVMNDIEYNQREARLIPEPVNYREEAETIRLTGNNVSMAYMAGLALQRGVSVNYTQNLSNDQTTITFRNPEDFARVCMPAGNEENSNFIYAKMAAASRCVMIFDEKGEVSGVTRITAETGPEDIKKTCEYLTGNPKTEEMEQACASFYEMVERDTADIRADISRSGSEAIAAPSAGKGGLPSCQIDYVERHYNIRTTYGAVAQPGQQQILHRKLAVQAQYMMLAIAMKNAVEQEMRAHEQRIREEALKKEEEEEEKKRKELEERLRKEKEEEERKKRERQNMLFTSVMALTIAAAMGMEGKEWLRCLMREQKVENLASMYSMVRAEEMAKSGISAKVAEKEKGMGQNSKDLMLR